MKNCDFLVLMVNNLCDGVVHVHIEYKFYVSDFVIWWEFMRLKCQGIYKNSWLGLCIY